MTQMLKSLLYVLLGTLTLTLPMQAQSAPVHIGPNPQLWSWPPCTYTGDVLNVAETFALGNIFADGSTVDEGDDFLEDNTPVCPALTVVNTFYETTLDHHIQGIIIQQGSSIDVAEEWAVWLRIWLPGGKQIRLKQQFDKHSANGQGNQHVYYPLLLFIPAGSFIQITRPAVVCVGIPSRTIINPVYNPTGGGDYGPYNQNNCITGQSVTFVAATP